MMTTTGNKGNEADIRKEIVKIVQKEYRLGMVNTFEGNVSVRTGDKVFITPSQVAKDDMTEAMIIEMDMDGKVTNAAPGMKPSSEYGMHLEVYRLRKDVRAIIHNHSAFATAFAVNGMPLESDALTEMNMFFGTVPVVPYGAPGTAEIYKDFEKYLGNLHGVLLENHGVLAFGPDLTQAFSNAEAFEKIAKTLFIARMIGKESKIDPKELKRLRESGSAARDKAIQEAISKE